MPAGDKTGAASAFVCAISGDLAEEPVVSPASGEIFEKRLIVKYIDSEGVDPVSKQPLKASELVPIKLNDDIRANARPIQTSSIPHLLQMLQNEWDALMLNNFTLRNEVQAAREELTHALYQNDAACRVINRLSLELASARNAMANIPAHRLQQAANAENRRQDDNGADENDVEMGDALPGLSEDNINRIQATGTELSQQRKSKGKKLPEGLASVETLSQFKETAVHTGLHSVGTPGINCLDLKGRITLTGGVDKTLTLFDLDQETIEKTFKGHRKPITSCIIHPNDQDIISASQDATVKVWSRSNEQAKHTINLHNSSVNDISLHPTNDFLLAFSEDQYWSLIDLNVGQALVKVKDDGDEAPITCGKCHPDGLIFGLGTRDSNVKIWDLRNQTRVALFSGHQGVVRTLAFSENGYYLASGADEGEVKIWDLRKLDNVKTFAIDDGKHPINSVSFDQSGAYLAAAARNVQIFQARSWKVVSTFETHTAAATSVRFGELAQFLVTVSLDKSLRVFN
ncbi:unnamed protein product [Bursaphelenchus xylophilus]|uniref:Pre-mRNA-processing factor 19 n=1 Tax=Bursaphelenchus xylophilus TaxID=6326 RepID=A0A1I7SX24_BURXY|nr:unnamed protein product [Bursaphelenchus xylophilus]CAG9100126.1 unnamed protein product [Bursaphelenchus xylophilus]